MTKGDTRSGQSELRAARRQSRGLFASVFVVAFEASYRFGGSPEELEEYVC